MRTNKRFTIHIILVIFFFLNKGFAQNTTTILYQTDASDFNNPERGFYRFSETKSSNFIPLDFNQINNYRTAYQTPGNGVITANFSVKSTLIQRLYVLDDFTSSSLSASFLTSVQGDMNTIRNAGLKVILRFFYNDPSSCSSPYFDAIPNTVKNHIQQLKQIFHTNKDVIATVQMGFIGCWGEQYYSDENTFGNLDGGDYNVPLSKWELRTSIIDSLLLAMPKERMIQVRFPHFKQKFIHGVNASSTSSGMMASEAYNLSDVARIGFHNDCFLAPFNDQGTYNFYPIGLNGTTDTTNLKPYFANDATYTVVGGETCQSNSNISKCLSDGGIVESELSRFKYSFLHADYNIEVLNTWTCIEEVKKKLGYRFKLVSGTFNNGVRPGQVLNIDMAIENLGFASPYNPKIIELVMKDNLGVVWKVPLRRDVRKWYSGLVHSINEAVCIPENMPEGNYQLFLHIGDPEPSIYNNPAYSIRLANVNSSLQTIFDQNTGFNNLLHTVNVSSTAPNTSNCMNNLLKLSKNVTSPCPPERYISDEFYNGADKLFRAAEFIKFEGIINGNATISLISGKAVDLEVVSRVDNSAIFKTAIGGCSSEE
ncbi:protein of unknown function [Spirosomataceae bacterium TFI 002]|nr:protein of unknown function [Spirosomataceae bacterium TFI 002]